MTLPTDYDDETLKFNGADICLFRRRSDPQDVFFQKRDINHLLGFNKSSRLYKKLPVADKRYFFVVKAGARARESSEFLHARAVLLVLKYVPKTPLIKKFEQWVHTAIHAKQLTLEQLSQDRLLYHKLGNIEDSAWRALPGNTLDEKLRAFQEKTKLEQQRKVELKNPGGKMPEEQLTRVTVTSFTYKKYTIRGVEDGGRAWFIANDIADALGYSSGHYAMSLQGDKEETRKFVCPDARQVLQPQAFMSAAAVYTLLMHSKCKDAGDFREFLLNQMLPTLLTPKGANLGADVTVVLESHVWDNHIFETTKMHGQTWFMADSIITLLGYAPSSNPMLHHVVLQDQCKFLTTDAQGRHHKKMFVNERGLFALIRGSKLPKAKEFQKHMTEQVLSGIHKEVLTIEVPPEEEPDATLLTDALQTFGGNGYTLRTLRNQGAPWFLARDVALALGFERTSNAVKYHVDSEDAQKMCIPLQEGGTQEAWFVNESGLYALTFGSKLPKAREFRRWVTSEVLPTIRQMRKYVPKPEAEVAMNPEVDASKYMQAFEAANALRYFSLRQGIDKKAAVDMAIEFLSSNLKMDCSPMRQLFEQLDTRKGVLRTLPKPTEDEGA